MSDGQALRAAVSALYAAPPADFIATRKEWVARLRSEGRKDVAKEVAALRKPSVSAAAINALVRADDPVAGQLRDVGTRLRHAQSALDAAGLAALRGDRDALLAAWAEAARTHAASSLTASVESEVRDTAVAALADAEATEVVLSGALTRSLSYSGFGEVDIADAVARTSTGVVLTRIDGGGQGTDAPDVEPAPPSPDGASGTAGDSAPDGTHSGGHAGEGEHKQDRHRASGSAHDLATLRADLEASEAVVTAARDRRRAAADAMGVAEEQRRVAASGVEQARRLLMQAEKHAAAAESTEQAARDEVDEAEEALAQARARRDGARASLEEAEDT